MSHYSTIKNCHAHAQMIKTTELHMTMKTAAAITVAAQ